jgi:hypothetical protein
LARSLIARVRDAFAGHRPLQPGGCCRDLKATLGKNRNHREAGGLTGTGDHRRASGALAQTADQAGYLPMPPLCGIVLQ